MFLGDVLLQLCSSPSTLLGVLAALLVCYLQFRSFFSQGEKKKEPPGPMPLPLLGNLLQLNLNKPHNTLCELSKKYGPVFTVYLGPQKVVVLAGYKTVKTALVNHAVEFGDRQVTPLNINMGCGHGIVFTNGEEWKELRRFALVNLKDFGMGKKVVEEKIVEEIQHLVAEFKKHKGEAFDVTQSVSNAVTNIVCSLVYGHRFEYSDWEFTSMINRAKEVIQLAGTPSVQLFNIFPWMGRWLSNYLRLIRNVRTNRAQIFRLITSLQQTLNTELCRGIVDCLLVHKQKLEDSGITQHHYTDTCMISTVGNLFSAGIDTTAATLRWLLLLMIKYPHVQGKVQEELRRVVGSRQVLVEDRKNLPYTDAVIHETQRLATILPIAIPHRTSADVTFQGFFISKGTTVYPLLKSVLWDDSEWESPQSFNPAHFLDKDGKFVRRDAFMPFSAGRRACIGEGLARAELFLFFASLLQHFRFTPPPGLTPEDLDLEPAVGFTLTPSPYKLCALSRW